MFVRYLGGGIGHLEQFPSANDSDEGDGGMEAEVDDFTVPGITEDGDGDGDGDGGDEDQDEEEEVGEDEGTDEDDGLETEEEEWLDEETGNVY